GNAGQLDGHVHAAVVVEVSEGVAILLVGSGITDKDPRATVIGCAQQVGIAGLAVCLAELDGDIRGAEIKGKGQLVAVLDLEVADGIHRALLQGRFADMEVELVGSRTAFEGVRAQSADQPICTGAAVEDVVALAAVQDIITGIAFQGIVALAAIQPVVTGAALEADVTCAAAQTVIALVARVLGVASATTQVVV